MQAFVTGSTGMVGHNLVRLLVAQGHRVRALVRSEEKAQRLLGDLDIEFVVGDMEDVAGFAEHLAGCDGLFHTAAYFREYFGRGDHWAKLQQINVDGTIDLLTAAEAQGVQKAIYVSSSGVIGAHPGTNVGDETSAPGAFSMENLYFRSKVLAEERIAQWLQTHTMPVVLILPVAILGPADAAPTRSGQLVVDFLNGKLPAVPPGGFTLVDARDVADALLAAVECGASGERYIIHNRYHSIADILDAAADAAGKPCAGIRLTPWMGMLYARTSEFLGRVTNTEPQATVSAMRTLLDGLRIESDKAQKALGITPRPLDDTMQATVQWFREHGYIEG